MPGPGIGLGILRKVPSLSFSLQGQPTGSLLISPARLHSAWLKGRGQGPSWAIVPASWPCLTQPLSMGPAHHADSHRPVLSRAKFSQGAPGNRKLYWWMELSLLFLIELNSTLGHLSSSIKKVSADGAITPTLCQLCLIHGMTSPAHHPAPLGTDAPTWFCLQCCNFFLFQKTIICLTNYTVFSQPIWINKHYVSSWGREPG